MRGALIALSLLAGACGDNTAPREPLFSGLSGSRIKLQWYLYGDGARQLETAAFYDAQLHVRCEPRRWADDVVRCAPIADRTVFHDAACTMEVGQSSSRRRPQFFVRDERIAGERRATKLFRAGKRVEMPPAAVFELRDDACTPIAEAPTTTGYFELDEEVDLGRLAELWSEILEGERLGLEVLASADGLRAPIGFRDQMLAIACRPAPRADGSAACVPTEPVRPAYFADVYCEQPLVVGPFGVGPFGGGSEPPRTIEVDDANGCALYHGAGPEHTGKVYARAGADCVTATLATNERAYGIGAALELAPVERVIEDRRGHRLQRITVAADDRVTLDDRLYDTATRGECRSRGNGEIAVCVPTSAIDGAHAYANPTCSLEVLVVDVPRAQCTPSKFAVVDGASIHAIGEPITTPLYMLDAGGACRPRPRPADAVTRELGAAIPPATFVAGVVYSER